jgi:HSP20 family protein
MAKKPGKVEVRKSGAPAPAASPEGMFGGSLQALQHEVDRLFEGFSRGFGLHTMMPRRIFDIEPLRGMERAFGAAGGLVPSIDIAEDDKELTVTAELPGLTEKDIQVVLSDDLLTVKGEKKVEKEEKKKNYYMSERSYGSFERSFRLPDTVDASKLSADFENGVLTVRAPKRAGAAKTAEKKIAIKSK